MDYERSRANLTIFDSFQTDQPSVWLSMHPGESCVIFEIVRAYEDPIKDVEDGALVFCMLKPSDVLVMAAYLKQLAENLLPKEAEFALEEKF